MVRPCWVGIKCCLVFLDSFMKSRWRGPSTMGELTTFKSLYDNKSFKVSFLSPYMILYVRRTGISQQLYTVPFFLYPPRMHFQSLKLPNTLERMPLGLSYLRRIGFCLMKGETKSNLRSPTMATDQSRCASSCGFIGEFEVHRKLDRLSLSFYRNQRSADFRSWKSLWKAPRYPSWDSRSFRAWRL